MREKLIGVLHVAVGSDGHHRGRGAKSRDGEFSIEKGRSEWEPLGVIR